jgi:flagella basal body P-ring formation protein FlgA
VEACDPDRIERVIADAARAIVGSDAVLKVEVMNCDVTAAASVDAALPEPGSRLGKPIRWRLMSGRQPQGRATAIVSGRVTHVQTTRSIAAGALLDASDLEVVSGEVAGAQLERFPTLDALVGARAARDVAANEVVTVRVARIQPAVRSGDRVTVRSTVGSVEVTGVATAQQSGEIGDVIRLVNPESRHTLRARITGKGAVEVVHGS